MKLKSQMSKYKKEDNVYLKYNFLLNIYSDIMLYVHMYSLVKYFTTNKYINATSYIDLYKIDSLAFMMLSIFDIIITTVLICSRRLKSPLL